MLKKNITYVNFNNETVTKPFYFNLSKAELLEMEARDEIGLANTLRRIIETSDGHGFVREIKQIILNSYGIKSDDGERFVKSATLREEFEQTPAYDIIMMELVSDEKAAADFINSVMPADMKEFIAEEVKKQEAADAAKAAIAATEA